jgi:hypothetical protein
VRAVALARAAGDGAAVARRAACLSAAGAHAEAAWLIERLDGPGREAVGPAIARALAATLAGAADGRVRAAATDLVRVLPASAWASLPLDALARVDSVAPLPERSRLLERAAAAAVGDVAVVEAALAVAPAVAPALARAVATRSAPSLEVIVRIARAVPRTGEDLAALARAAAPALGAAADLAIPAELLALSGGRELRLAVVRLALKLLPRDDATHLLARELPAARDPDLEREAAARVSALLGEGRLDAGEAARLGPALFRAALGRLGGAFNLRLQSGLERLAERTPDRAILLVALDALVALADPELGKRVAARVRARAGWDQDRELRERVTALGG